MGNFLLNVAAPALIPVAVTSAASAGVWLNVRFQSRLPAWALTLLHVFATNFLNAAFGDPKATPPANTTTTKGA